MDGTCKLHGKVKYLYGKLANAKICNRCVQDGFYRADITEEIYAQYPHLMGPRKTPGAVTKSYALTPAQQAEVDQAVARGKEKYDSIEDVVLESQFDAGPFFEQEISEKIPGADK